MEVQALAKEVVFSHNKLPRVKSQKAGGFCKITRAKQLN